MAAASPVPSPVRRPTGGEKRIIAYLRELREETQNLQKALEKVKTASELTDPQTRMLLVGAALESKEKFDRNQRGIRDRLDAIEAVFDGSEDLHAQYGDAITEIHNLWDDIVAHWPNGDGDIPALAARIKEVGEDMDRIVYLCALLTVPERVNQNLETMRVGQAMDFRMQFSDEVPDEGQGRKILDYLALHPKLVNGLVDNEAGLIYRSSARPERRIASVIVFLVFLFLPVPVVLWTGILPLLGIALEPRTVVLTYAAIAAGSLIHIAVTWLKQQRSAKAGTGVLVADWLLWVHVKETQIVYGILFLWVGLAGWVWLLGTTEMGQASLSGAFFVGYSLDSFVDLFLSRFETGANAATEAARAKVKAASQT
jgi:hypothetical protein